MGWINTSWRFPRRAALLTITKNDSVELDILGKVFDMIEVSPELLEEWFRELVVKARPELEGCTLVYLNFSFCCYRWELGVEHPSLPETRDGDPVIVEPLLARAESE
jgi:hypothetical protein